MRHARPDYQRIQDPSGKIPADEPVFLLRGQDRLAWAAVRHYAITAGALGLTDIAEAAGAQAGVMQAWARKLPDMPAGTASREVGEESALLRMPLSCRDNAVYDSDGRLLFGVNTCTVELEETRAITKEIVRVVNTASYTEGRKQHWLDEAQRLALLVRSLGGDPEPGAAPPDASQRPGPAEAIANIESFLRDMAKEPYGDDPEQLVATAPMDPPDGGSRQQGMITIGDLKAVLAAFRPYPGPVIEHSRKRLAGIEERWNSEEHECPTKGEISMLLRLAKAYLNSPMNADPAPALKERAEICKALGCVDKPGVPLQFVLKLQEANTNHWKRQQELLRSWDKATPTERQELDRMRRGWGPSTPTERNRRHADVLGCLSILSSAMHDVTFADEDALELPEEAQQRLDEAYNRLDKRHTEMLAIVEALNKDPAEWPDIKAAEERGAMAMLASLKRPQFRTGDCVVNKHNGESLTVAWADPETGMMSWFGHPPGRAPSADFTLTLGANEEVHKLALLQLKRSGGPIAEKALAFYGAPEVANG